MAAVQFVFTVGTVVLGLYVASKVLGIEPGEGRGRGSKGQKWGSGRCVRYTHMPSLPCASALICGRGVPIALYCANLKGLLACCQRLCMYAWLCIRACNDPGEL